MILCMNSKLQILLTLILAHLAHSNLNFSVNDPVCVVKTPGERFDCYPEDLPTKEKCSIRGCCWIDSIELEVGVPKCYFPSNFPSYKVVQTRENLNGYSYQIYKETKTFRENEILNLTVDLFYESNERLRVKIVDSNNQRYQVPLNVDENKHKFEKRFNSDYYVNIIDEPFAIKIYRKSTQTLM